jgi:hypothetical protein
MSLSREPVQHDQQLIRYLLGMLPEEEVERIEEASIVDDDVAARLSVVEDDLVDAYVSGTLDPAMRARFEEFYMASPRRREKVHFAQRFLGAVDRAPVSPSRVALPAAVVPATIEGSAPQSAGGKVTFSKRFLAKLDKLVRQAAALLLIALGVLVFEYLRVRHGLDDARQERLAQNRQAETLVAELNEARAAHADTAKALERARASLAERRQQQSAAERSNTTAASAAIVLAPQTRSLGPLPTVALWPGADRIAFDLRLEANDFVRYRARLKDAGTRRAVWSSDVLTPRSAGSGLVVSLLLPVAALEPRHYIIELAGLTPAGGAEPVGDYVFQLERRWTIRQ